MIGLSSRQLKLCPQRNLCRALLDRTAEGGCPHVSIVAHCRALLGRDGSKTRLHTRFAFATILVRRRSRAPQPRAMSASARSARRPGEASGPTWFNNAACFDWTAESPVATPPHRGLPRWVWLLILLGVCRQVREPAWEPAQYPALGLQSLSYRFLGSLPLLSLMCHHQIALIGDCYDHRHEVGFARAGT
jgi:hypothetical protein